MPFELLHSRLPDIAEAETRTITVLESNDGTALPSGEYAFLEMFCNEPGCDCRRVFFNVISSRTQDTEAIIAYGWESAGFYRNWFKCGSKEDIAMLIGPELNMGSPQGRHAGAILLLFKNVLLHQAAYIGRVKHHYKLFRATVDPPRNPLLRRRRTGG